MTNQVVKLDRVLLDLLDSGDDDESSICRLSDIQTARAWDYSLPTLTKSRRFTDRNTYVDDGALMESLMKINNGFVHLVLTKVGALDNDNHIVLYGGALLDIILKREEQINDFDLRLIGSRFANSPDACVDEAKKFVATIFDVLLEINVKAKKQEKPQDRQASTFDVGSVMVARSQSTVTVEIPMASSYYEGGQRLVKFQFTFSPYATVLDLLNQCHPQCTRLAISNKEVKLTRTAKYCIENLCIVMDAKSLAMYSVPQYGTDEQEDAKEQDNGRKLSFAIRRVTSYFEDKGFDIILPDLNMDKVPRRNLKFKVHEVLDLPLLTVIVDSISDKKIMVSSLCLTSLGAPGEMDSNAYDLRSSFNVGTSIHHNIRCLVSNVYNKFHFVAQGQVYEHIFDFVPLLTTRMILQSYETIKESFTSTSIDLETVISYFSATTPDKVIDFLVVDPFKKRTYADGRLPQAFVIDINVVDEIIKKEVASLQEKTQKMRIHMLSIGGLDNIVLVQPQQVSTKEQLLKALYGDYCLEI